MRHPIAGIKFRLIPDITLKLVFNNIKTDLIVVTERIIVQRIQ